MYQTDSPLESNPVRNAFTKSFPLARPSLPMTTVSDWRTSEAEIARVVTHSGLRSTKARPRTPSVPNLRDILTKKS